MEWLVLTISIVLLGSNLLYLLKIKRQPTDHASEVYENMAHFVTQLEKENDELYHKLITYIKGREAQLLHRIEILERHNKSEAPETKSAETEKILQLSRQGFSSKQIAKVLELDFGKVELVLTIHTNQQNHYEEEVR